MRVSSSSHQITVSVRTEYRVVESDPSQNVYFYVYHITIANQSKSPVQLLSRTWLIQNGIGENRMIEGEGVIGVQPIIEPNETFSYASYCELNTPIGSMHGHYTMTNLHTQAQMSVLIPKFRLEALTLQN
jgi:ApaG protein